MNWRKTRKEKPPTGAPIAVARRFLDDWSVVTHAQYDGTHLVGADFIGKQRPKDWPLWCLMTDFYRDLEGASKA